MGIHGCATSVMSFENSIGWMIGQENAGLQAMFTFMNTARIGSEERIKHFDFE
jgi:acyl-CoA dehydrogenase